MTLDELYTALVNANSNGQLNLVPGVLSSGAIADFYQKITLQQPFIINNATIEKSADGKTVSVKNGNISMLNLVNFPVKIDFTAPSTDLVSSLNGDLVDGTWEIAGIDWFTLGNPTIAINASDDTKTTPTGSLSGGVEIGIPLTLTLNLPISANQWVFNASFNKPYPSISYFSQLIGGVNISNVLPAPLNVFGDIGLGDLSLIYNEDDTNVAAIGVILQTSQSWPLFGKLTLDNLEIILSVTNPGNTQTRATDIQVNGYFSIGTAEQNSIKATGFYPPAVMQVQLMQGTIQLGDLLTLFWENASIELQSEIDALFVQIKPSSKDYLLSCNIKTDWTFFTLTSPNLSLTMTGLGLAINSQQGNTTGKINGTFHIGPNTPNSGVDLSMFAEYDGKAWSFGASTGQDQTIALGDIATTFLEAFGMSNIPTWVTNNLPEISNVNFLATKPDDKTQKTTYNIKGDVAWNLAFGSFDLQLDANVDITYDGATSGKITGTADASKMLGLTFIVGYEFGKADTELSLQIPQFSSTITYTQGTDSDVLDITFKKISLGEIISTLVGTFSPGFTLPAPWNVLNSIDLSGSEFKYTRFKDSSKSSIVATIPLKIDLGFINITSVKITKDGTATSGSGVYMYLEGTFLGLPIENDSPLQKDGKGSDATQMPPVPGMGSEMFDLRLLAMGQHVSMYDVADIPTVNAAITALSKAFTTNTDSGSTNIPVPASSTTPGTLVFDQNSNWLIGADFTVAKFYRIAAVFNDPNMYGLLIGIDPKAGFLANLQFEILYKKINDSIGMYQLDLQLPDQFRHLEFGEVSITLPIIGVKIYTNGNFYIDFGFPASITDFSRSFSLQVFPFVGYGGFYFGYLNGATSTNVPATTCGTFNPVIELGLGLSLGVGKTIDEGILKAGLSLTAVGIFQGVLGFFRANQNLQTHDETYYKLQGTFGLTGHIYGEINFAIISARLDIMAYAYITITIESYKPIPITFEAGVSVSLTVKINLGLFSIKVSLHFKATVSASFTIGSDTSASAPWNLCPVKPASQQVLMVNAGLIGAAPAETIALKWQPIKPAAPVPLDLVFFPQLTVAGETVASGPQYEAMLYINTASNDDSLAELTKGVLLWCINALIGNTHDNTGLTWLEGEPITADQISQLLCYFNTRPNQVPPFNYKNTSGNDIQSFLSNYFHLNIAAADATTSTQMEAAVFPVVPELILNTIYKGTAGNAIHFDAVNKTGTKDYITDITNMLAKSAIEYQSQTTADYYNNDTCNNITNPDYQDQPDLSFPTFIFTDFIALVGKQALQAALDYLNTQDGATAKVSDVVAQAVTNSVQGIGGMASRFMLHGLRLPAPPVAATGVLQPLYLLTGQQLAIPTTLATKEAYSITLQSNGEQWIVLKNAVNNTLTITIDDTEIQRILNMAGTKLTPTLVSPPAALTNYHDTPQTFSLGSPALWQYPGDYYPAVTNSPTLWKLPSNLSAIFSTGGDWLFDINTLKSTSTGNQLDKAKNYSWATTINITLQKITAQGGQITPLSGNVYSLVGADDAGIVFLEELITYLNNNNDGDGKKTIQQIQVLYQPDPVSNSKGGYVSAANGEFKTAIVQANLSTETNPIVGSLMMAFAAQATPERSYNTLNDAGDFVKLLWECSIVRSGGFYFYYNDSSNKGLPDTLFNGNGIASLSLVITYDNLIVAPFMNSVVLGDEIDTSDTSVFAQSPASAPATQQYTTRVATLLPGTVGYEVARKNPDTVVPALPADELYLQSQYNLMGLSLPQVPSYVSYTPAGPADPMSTDDLASSKSGPAAPTDDAAIWNYNAVVPFYKYVQPAGTDPNFPNPYAGIGTTVQMNLNWQDMFGNVLTAGVAPLSASMPLLYSDTILALSQWPSAAVYYVFNKDATTGLPNLYLYLTFNTSRYEGKGGPDNAQNDLQTYMKLYYQLAGNDMAVTFTTTLENSTDGQGNVVTTNHNIDLTGLFNNFLNPIISYLKAAASSAPLPTVTYYTIATAVDTTNITSLPLIASLEVHVTMQRTAHLDPQFADVAGVAFATTTIQPVSQNNWFTPDPVNAFIFKVQPPDNTKPPADKKPPTDKDPAPIMSNLNLFAQCFETAFINQPVAGVVLKVATGTNLSKANSDASATAPIWLVRFDTNGTHGLKFGFNKDELFYFSPIPLATSLQSFSAPIAAYQTGKPYPLDPSRVTKNFTSIDMDSWGQQFLQAVDKFLSPAYAVPAYLLTANSVFGGDPNYLQQVLDAKQTLAEAIEGTIDYIITPSNTAKNAANIGNAQEKWKQQLLNQLSNAYRFVASVQTTAQINSPFTGVNNEPQQAPYVPALYGNMGGLNPSIPGSTTAPKSTEYSLSTAKVPTANGNSWLTYLFEAKDAAESRSFTFGDMKFKLSHVEFDMAQVPEMDDYLASSWLAFVIPFDGNIAGATSPLAGMSDVGLTPIPVPLRAYPTPPSISAQNFEYPAEENTTVSPTIKDARIWNYSYTYQNPSAAQDTVITSVQFNVTQDHQDNARAANTTNLPLYQALAQFMNAYPAISADFDQYLSQLTPATLNSTSAIAINARYAMLAFIQMVQEVATQWSITNQVNPRKAMLLKSLNETPAAPYTLNYSITESPEDVTENLLIVIAAENAESATVQVDVQIPGYTLEAVPNEPNTFRYYQKDAQHNITYLTYADRNSVPSRTVEINGLDILNTQNAWSSVAVIRNEELLEDGNGGWQTTNPYFIYQTPLVMFYNKLIPLLSLDAQHQIDIASIGTATYPVQPQRTLATQMLALFDVLTADIGSGITGYTLKMACNYTYTILGTTFPIEIPVLLITPTELSVADKGASLANMLSTAIATWQTNNNPESYNGCYTFTFTAYSTTDAYVPILQIPLVLSLTAIAAS